MRSKEPEFSHSPKALEQKKIFYHKEMQKSDEELLSIIEEDFKLISPNERYKKYLKLLDTDPRVWKRSFHILHLFADYLIIGISLRFLFRSLRLRNRKYEYYTSYLPSLGQITFRSYTFFLTNGIFLFYLYNFSRYFLYEAAYDTCYNFKLISNKDFLDLCDSMQIKSQLKRNL